MNDIFGRVSTDIHEWLDGLVQQMIRGIRLHVTEVVPGADLL
jgi:hypothetical protein